MFKRLLIALIAILPVLVCCNKTPEPQDTPTEHSSDPSVSEDPSEAPSVDPSTSEDPFVVPQDQVSEDPDFEVPEEKTIEMVDMGGSVKWAACNLGASSPEEFGQFFAWGETTVKDNYSLSTYKWGSEVQANNTYFNISKYNVDYIVGNFDFNIVLDPEDDPATVALGEGWRLPTREEMEELLRDCTWTVKDGGVEVKAGNGNSIFLPGAGFMFNEDFYPDECFYWTSTLAFDEGQNQAYALLMDGNTPSLSSWTRFHGLSVRPVYGSAAKEPDPLAITYCADGISPSGAQLSGYLYPRTSLSGVEAGIVIAKDSHDYFPTLESGNRLKATSIGTDSKFTVSATGLTTGMEYAYRAYCIVDGEVQYGVIQFFRTGQISVTTMPAEDVTQSKATLKGRLSVANYESLGVNAFYYYSLTAASRDDLIERGTKASATINRIDSGAAELVGKIDLSYGKTYYYVFGVEIGSETYYGDARSVKAKEADVTISFHSDKKGETTASYAGRINIQSSESLATDFNFIYSMVGSSDEYIMPLELDAQGYFELNLHGLKWNQMYECHIQGTVEGIDYCSPTQTITTRDFSMRSVNLGLQNGKRWANANIGARTLSDMGWSYAWGMVEKIYVIGDNWNPDLLPKDFPGYEQDLLYHKIAHYMELYSSLGLGALMKDHTMFSERFDVAAVTLGGKWRVPSYDDFENLFFECELYDYPWAECIEVVGPNGSAILLPKTNGDDSLRYWTRSSGQQAESSEMVSTCWEINGPSIISNDIKWLNEQRYIEYYIRPIKEL